MLKNRISKDKESKLRKDKETKLFSMNQIKMGKLGLAMAVAGAVVTGGLANQRGLATRSVLGFAMAPRLLDADLELIQAQIVFRHGARSPFQDSPDAPKIWAADLRANAAHMPSSFQLIDYSTGAKLPLSHALEGSAGVADRSLSEEKSLGGGLKCGMLTQPGFEQACMLGKQLHESYVRTGFVTSPEQVLLRSSLTARTMETLFGCISGMFSTPSSFVYPVVVGKKGQVLSLLALPAQEYKY